VKYVFISSTTFFWNISYSENKSEIYVDVYVKNPLLLSDCNETLIFSTYFLKILKYLISLKTVQWEPCFFARTDMIKPIFVFRNFAYALKNISGFCVNTPMLLLINWSWFCIPLRGKYLRLCVKHRMHYFLYTLATGKPKDLSLRFSQARYHSLAWLEFKLDVEAPSCFCIISFISYEC
jgi:hypothetical protein